MVIHVRILLRACDCLLSGTSGQDSMGLVAFQKGSVGHNSVPLLPQLGHIHFVDMDANILQPSLGDGFDEFWLVFRPALDYHVNLFQLWWLDCWQFGAKIWSHPCQEDHAVGENVVSSCHTYQMCTFCSQAFSSNSLSVAWDDEVTQ